MENVTSCTSHAYFQQSSCTRMTPQWQCAFMPPEYTDLLEGTGKDESAGGWRNLWAIISSPAADNRLRLTLTTSVCPPAQAYIRGVLPEEDWALTSALWAIKSFTISTWPAEAPSIRGVQSPLMPLSSTLARMARRTCNG